MSHEIEGQTFVGTACFDADKRELTLVLQVGELPLIEVFQSLNLKVKLDITSN
jgi:hypothetical protein